MKKLMIAIAAIFLMAGCKKETVVTGPTPTHDVIKNLVKWVRVYDNGTPETEEYSYDATGKITVFKNDNRTSTFNFVSANSLVVTEKNNAGNSLNRTFECTLDDLGYVRKMVVKNAAAAFVYSCNFTYDADGLITNQKSFYADGSTIEEVYIIAGGNAVSSKLYYNNVLSNSRIYSYDATKVDKTQLSYNGYWTVPGLFGKSAKNMRTEFKDFDASGTLSWHSKSTYDMDADGFPVKQTTDYIFQGKKAIVTFIYQ